MAEVHFKKDAKISISDGAVEYARKLIEQENTQNRKLREFTEHRIKCYEDGIEECEKHQLYGKMLHYPEILKELQNLLEDSEK